MKVAGFYSDLLYQAWHCATVPLPPQWLEVDNVDRRSGMTLQQFREQYELPNRPVILTDVVTRWPAMRKWTPEYLAAAFQGQDVIVGGYRMRFADYLAYCNSCAGEDMPLYLFDKGFADKAPQLAQDYTVPEYFSDDLFALLGPAGRPDHRWLILGPARSGSSFHKDPNATSAWNGVVAGSKRWLLLPPGTVPPGVHPSADGADVAAPVSLVEWYLNFYQEHRPELHAALEAQRRQRERKRKQAAALAALFQPLRGSAASAGGVGGRGCGAGSAGGMRGSRRRRGLEIAAGDAGADASDSDKQQQQQLNGGPEGSASGEDIARVAPRVGQQDPASGGFAFAFNFTVP